jgi:hypothetical protein
VIIAVDLTGGTAVVELAEPEDCKRFSVAVSGGDGASLEAALTGQGIGRLLPSGDALVDIGAVRRMAEGRVAAGWDDEFAGMLGYARSKGWLDETGTSIQAHVERTG